MMLTQGASLENEREAQIFKKEYTIDNDGNYNFRYVLFSRFELDGMKP